LANFHSHPSNFPAATLSSPFSSHAQLPSSLSLLPRGCSRELSSFFPGAAASSLPWRLHLPAPSSSPLPSAVPPSLFPLSPSAGSCALLPRRAEAPSMVSITPPLLLPRASRRPFLPPMAGAQQQPYAAPLLLFSHLALLARPPAAMADLHSLGAGSPNSHGALPYSPAPSLPSSLPWARAPPPAMDAARDPLAPLFFFIRAAPYSTSMAAQLPWTPRNSSSEPPSSLFVVVPTGCSTKYAASRALQQPSRSISTPLVVCRRSRARCAAPSMTPSKPVVRNTPLPLLLSYFCARKNIELLRVSNRI
jgi:hypothetical protein